MKCLCMDGIKRPEWIESPDCRVSKGKTTVGYVLSCRKRTRVPYIWYWT